MRTADADRKVVELAALRTRDSRRNLRCLRRRQIGQQCAKELLRIQRDALLLGALGALVAVATSLLR